MSPKKKSNHFTKSLLILWSINSQLFSIIIAHINFDDLLFSHGTWWVPLRYHPKKVSEVFKFFILVLAHIYIKWPMFLQIVWFTSSSLSSTIFQWLHKYLETGCLIFILGWHVHSGYGKILASFTCDFGVPAYLSTC